MLNDERVSVGYRSRELSKSVTEKKKISSRPFFSEPSSQRVLYWGFSSTTNSDLLSHRWTITSKGKEDFFDIGITPARSHVAERYRSHYPNHTINDRSEKMWAWNHFQKNCITSKKSSPPPTLLLRTDAEPASIPKTKPEIHVPPPT